MTVKTSIINHGNHPEDLIWVVWNDGKNRRQLIRGESIGIGDNIEYHIRTINHGSGKLCRNHDAMAIPADGVGRGIVRTDFNPEKLDGVARIKTLAAALINEIDTHQKDARLCDRARDAVEDAAMLGVKAATADHTRK